MFTDREDAGRQLAEKMLSYHWNDPLILAVPRGGVIIAYSLLENLGGDLDLHITRKIGSPQQPELAIGAVSGDGNYTLNQDIITQFNISHDYIERKASEEQQEIKRRMKAYRGDRPLPSYEKRQIILVDDGVATGSTLLAAIKGLRQNNPAELIIAVPVGPPDTFHRLGDEVDQVFYLKAPGDFAAVGQFYLCFDQVTDNEVIAILRKVWGECT